MTEEEKPEVLIGPWLRRRGLWLATAESCTGGLIGHLVTNVPGSSDYYAGGVVAYANEVKIGLLGVPAGLLGMYGAVSREAAIEMARGVREALRNGMDPARVIGVAVTGIAGPGGGTQDKPVGLTWIGFSAGDLATAHRFVWTGNREQNKRSSAVEALALVLDFLRGAPRRGD